jgi:16S rRNA (uracil1498-N3)-methyltransferase
MHRCVVDTPLSEGTVVTLNKEESAHCAKVLRLRSGDAVQLLDGENLHMGVLDTVSDSACTVQVGERCPSPEAPAKAVLWQGLPKADKLELIAQKGTEMGMWALWTVEMTRSIAKADKGGKDEKKRERLSRIALEAAKQSGRAHVPEIAPVRSLNNALKDAAAEGFDLILVAWEEEHALPLSKAVGAYTAAHGAPEKVLIVIGPEGGISPEEKARLDEIGAQSVTLGKRILRTETAGLCALAALWTALGEM